MGVTNSPWTPGAVILVIICYYGLKAVYNVTLHPLSSYPGPKLWAMTPLPFMRWEIRGQLYKVLSEFHEKYGDVVRIGPNKVSYTDPEAWEEIYGHVRGKKPKTHIKDPNWYIPFFPGAPDVVTSNGADHSRIRRLMSHGFSERAITDQEKIIQSWVETFFAELRKKIARDGAVVDLGQWFNLVTFDIAGDLGFGKDFDCLRREKLHEWVQVIFDSVRGMIWMGLVRLLPASDFLISTFMPKHVWKTQEEHRGFATQRAKERIAMGQAERPDFFGYMLRHQDSKENGLTEGELAANASVLVAAGAETSAMLTSTCVFILAKFPDKLRLLEEEIFTRCPRLEDLTLHNLAQLPYLQACIDEVLRIHPSASMIHPRVVDKGGDIISGRHVPEGTIVGCPVWACSHSTKNFREPTKFYPERWLGDPAFAGDNLRSFYPFLMGPRGCLGRNLAYAEVRLLLSRVIHEYTFEVTEDAEEWFRTARAYGFWYKPMIPIKLTKREEPPVLSGDEELDVGGKNS